MASTGAFDFDHDLAVDAEVDASGWAEEGGIEVQAQMDWQMMNWQMLIAWMTHTMIARMGFREIRRPDGPDEYRESTRGAATVRSLVTSSQEVMHNNRQTLSAFWSGSVPYAPQS